MPPILRTIFRLGWHKVLPLAVVILLLFPMSVAALTKEQKDAFRSGIYYFDTDGNQCAAVGTSPIGSGSSGSSNPASQSGSWNSGLQPPYILEQMMIEALKNIGQKANIPLDTILTEQHVIAMVGMAFGEGGDISNGSVFNPFNSGLNAPELIDGAHAGDGTQSFKSFDAGVEAIARSFTQPGKTRFIGVLSDKNSTVPQFIYALTYFQKYPGNTIWAQGSDPRYDPKNPDYDYTKEGAIPPASYQPQGDAGQKLYYDRKLGAAQSVANRYGEIASLVIGTPAEEQSAKLTQPELLQFHPSGNVSYQNSGSGSSGSCVCNAEGLANTAGAPVIVIDPGHGGEVAQTTDPVSGIIDHNTHNSPETEDVFDVSQLVKTKLETDGYKVIMTKNAALDKALFRQRVDIANNAKANLAISIHYQGDKAFSDPNLAQVYVQRDGQYRTNTSGTNVVFNNAAVATKSQEYGNIVAAERGRVEGRAVRVMPDASGGINGGRGGTISPGNIWAVQLLSNVPWIYNEVGGSSAGGSPMGLNQTDKQKYADGLVAGVEKAVPKTTGPASATSGAGCSGGVVASSIAQTAINLSWPDRASGNNNYDIKPAYKPVLEQYNPSAPFSGRDCGSFVGTVMRATGADPNYPLYGTYTQYPYVKAHPELYDVVDSVSSTADLLPGDIMIVTGKGGGVGHTYIYVGLQPNGTDEASASYQKRYPGLGKAKLSDSRGNYLRARLKK